MAQDLHLKTLTALLRDIETLDRGGDIWPDMRKDAQYYLVRMAIEIELGLEPGNRSPRGMH